MSWLDRVQERLGIDPSSKPQSYMRQYAMRGAAGGPAAMALGALIGGVRDYRGRRERERQEAVNQRLPDSALSESLGVTDWSNPGAFSGTGGPLLMSGQDFASVGFDNYGRTDSGADVGIGYEDYGSILAGQPNDPENYVELVTQQSEGQRGDKAMEMRAKELGWSGVMGQGANGETLIRGVQPMTQNRYVYNKAKDNRYG